LLSLGAKVFALGKVGVDPVGEELLSYLKDKGADISLMIKQSKYPTILKNRFVCDQQIMRVDFEQNILLEKDIEDQLLNKISSIIDQFDVIAISDYKKGFLSKNLLEKILEMARRNNISTLVDPKGIDFTIYEHATLIKPNLKEAYHAAKLPLNEPLEKVSQALLEQTNAKYLLITRSEKGMSLFSKNNREDFSVKMKELVDVTGAGDTVLAVLAYSLGNKIDLAKACMMSNIAAGIAIEKLGCARISLTDIAKRLLELDLESKIFDESHFFILRKLLKGKNFTVLYLDKNTKMSTILLKKIHQLSENQELVLYVDKKEDDELVVLLSSMREISYIILQKESLKNLCDNLGPKEIIEIKDEQIISHQAKLFLKSIMQKVSS